MRMLRGFLLSVVVQIFAAQCLAAAPLVPTSCAHDACATQFLERVAHKHHHHRKSIFPPVEADDCPPGEVPGKKGNCVPAASNRHKGNMPPVEECAAGQNMDPATGVCFSCSHNDHFENGRCVPCQEGFHVDGDSCVAD